jgi:hypothetical protein
VRVGRDQRTAAGHQGVRSVLSSMLRKVTAVSWDSLMRRQVDQPAPQQEE